MVAIMMSGASHTSSAARAQKCTHLSEVVELRIVQQGVCHGAEASLLSFRTWEILSRSVAFFKINSDNPIAPKHCTSVFLWATW